MNKQEKKLFILVTIILGVLVVAGILVFLIINNQEKIIGGDQDEYGCYLMAGYNWCESKQKCVRYWEEGCEDCETDSDCVVFGETGDCNCGCYNKETLPNNSGGECFCAAPTSCKCINNKCEPVFE